MARVIVKIFYDDLSIVFNPSLPTQDVMDAGCHLVPCKMVFKTVRKITHKKIVMPCSSEHKLEEKHLQVT